jgi:HK97 family phage major capsid protein
MIVEKYREEFSKLHKDCNDLLTLVANRKDKPDFSGEEKTAQEARFARMDQIKALSEQEVKLAGYQFASQQDQRAIEDAVTHGANDPRGAAAMAAALAAGRAKGFASREEFTRRLEDNDPAAIALARRGLNHFMCKGTIPDEFKFVITTSTDSGIMLPQQVMAPYLIRRNVNALRLAISYYGYVPLKTTTTDQIKLPVWDDRSNVGATLSESSTSNDTADSSLTGSVTLNAPLYESKCKWFSNTLLNAEGFDVLSYVAPVLQIMFDKGQEAAFTTTAQGAFTGNYIVPGSQTGITYQDLLNWEHTLAVAYRRDAVFVLSDSLYKTARGMVDSNKRPIIDLNPAGTLAQGSGPLFIEQIHGKPIAVSDYMTAVDPTVAAAGTLKTGLFCSADAIKLRDVVPQRLTRYVNVPTFPDQTGYNLFGNGDCQFVNAGGALFIY